MFRPEPVPPQNCRGPSRREILQVGACSLLGLSMADLFHSRSAAMNPHPRKRDRSCIFVYLAGGPSQLETFDPKPQAPVEIRGPWSDIATSVPGTRISELLPQLAACADQFALIRSLHHTNSDHKPIPMITGSPEQTASYGAAFTYLTKGSPGIMPPYVHMGGNISVKAGALGGSFEPLEVRDPRDADDLHARLTLPPEVPIERLTGREGLLGSIDRRRKWLEESGAARHQEACHQRALETLTSSQVRAAFDLRKEAEALRDRYGANFFGQSCLLSRRLIEAGTRFVQIMWYEREDGFAVGWDVHGYDAPGLGRMEQHLCPRFDQGLSALLEDLKQRGLMNSTLVCVVGEFGRTPTINRHGGRDHWPYCFSALLAGAGIRGGVVVGASDARAAYPVARPVKPVDFAATIYHLLGVDVGRDDRLRSAVFEGSPIHELCG